MLYPTLITAFLAIILLAFGYMKGQGINLPTIKKSLGNTVEIVPLIIFAFIIAGMIQNLLPREILVKWLGAESGLKGLLIGTFAGGLTLGGPYVSLPVAVGLFRAGAGIGTMVAFLTGWSLWGIGRIPMEIAILGWKLWLIRIVCTFFFPPIAGFIAQTLFSGIK
ncbi:MAG: permease [Candidatus Aminicenantales bacterium]